MNVLDRLDEARAQTNLLEHPFYRRWVAGELAPRELCCYAGEYRHAVVALAATSATAAAQAPARHREQLQRHAQEEQAHIALWDQFACATGGDPGGSARSRALRETRACVRAWTAGEDLLERLAVLYAIEAGQPEISATKLDGLIGRYGYSPEGPALEYFALHSERDVEHADQARELIADLMSDGADHEPRSERMVARARAALRGNWTLLDGVQRSGQR